MKTRLSAWLAALAATLPLNAQSPLPPALPDDTLVLVSFPDLRASLQEFQQMPLAKMWREPEVQDFFADALKMVEEHWEQGMAEVERMHAAGQLPIGPDDLKMLRLDSLSYAVTRLDLGTTEGGEPDPRVGLVVHVDFGQSAPIWRHAIEAGLGMLQQQAGDALQRSEQQVGETTLIQFRPQGYEGAMGLNLAFVGSGLVFGTLADETTTVLANLADGKQVLTATEHWRTTARPLPAEGAEALVYVRPGGVLDFGIEALEFAKAQSPEFPEQLDIAGLDRAIEALGLRAVEGLGLAARYEDGRSVSTAHFVIPAERRKGLFGGGETLDLGFLKWVPKDAVSFSSQTLDLASIYTSLVDALRAYDQELAEHLLGQLATYEEQLGISVKNDLFGAFGDQLVYWSMPMAAISAAPEMAVLLEVKDQQRLLTTLQTLAELSQGAVDIDEVETRGITVWQVRIDAGGGGGMGGFNPMDMFTPTFGFKNGYAVFGLSASDVKRVFTRMDREDDPSGDIRSNEEFAPYLEQMPEGGLSSLSFTDWKAQFESLYQLATSVLAFVPIGDEIPFDLSLLPDSSTLTQHLFGAVAWSTWDETGFRTTSIGPFGPEVVALVGGLAGAGAALMGAHDSTVRFR